MATFKHLFLVLAALCVLPSCVRVGEEDWGVRPGGGDGRLVFTVSSSYNPNPVRGAFRAGKTIGVLDLGDSLSLRAVRTDYPAGDAAGTKVYSDECPFDTFSLSCYTWDYGSGKYARYAIDECDRVGDRWISRKDTWGSLRQDAAHPPLFIAFTPDSGDEPFLALDDTYCEFLDVEGFSGAPTPDLCWGMGYFSGMRALQALSFRHAYAAVTVRVGLMPDCRVTAVSLTTTSDGSMMWHPGEDMPDFCDSYPYGLGYSTQRRDVNAAVSYGSAGTYLVGLDNPFLVVPQREAFQGYNASLDITVRRGSTTKTYTAGLDGIDFPSGTNTVLEVTMSSEVVVSVPDAVCVWDGEESLPASVSVVTNMPQDVFSGRSVSYEGRYASLAGDPSDPCSLTFTPRWNNFTHTPWTEPYTVSCGTVSSTASVTVEPGYDYGELLAGLPSVLFIGTDYDLDTRFESLYTGRIYPYPLFLTEYDYESDYISVSSEGTVTPLDVTPSARTLTVSGGSDGDVSYFAEDNFLTLRYEVAEPLLEVSPASLSFSASDALQTAVTGLPRELRTVISDGRKLWTVPAGDAADFSTNASWPYYTSRTLWLEYYNPSSSVVSLSGSFTDTNVPYVSSIPFRESLDVPPGHGFMTGLGAKNSSYLISSVSVSPSGGPLAVNILKGAYNKVITVSSRHPWEVSSCPGWVVLSAVDGGTASTSALSASVRVAVLPNGTDAPRTGTVVLRSTDGTGLSRSVTVTQEAGTSAGGIGGSGFGGSDETEDAF